MAVTFPKFTIVHLKMAPTGKGNELNFETIVFFAVNIR